MVDEVSYFLKNAVFCVTLLCAMLYQKLSCFEYLFSKIDWGKDQEDENDKKIWEDNWDDDNVEDDFSLQLR